MKMKNKAKKTKQKLIAAGTISAVLGTIGVLIESLGLCACFWAPVLSLAGITSIIAGFLSKTKIIFMAIGIILLVTGIFFYKRKKSCRIHK